MTEEILTQRYMYLMLVYNREYKLFTTINYHNKLEDAEHDIQRLAEKGMVSFYVKLDLIYEYTKFQEIKAQIDLEKNKEVPF